jgi:hypothetical protein
MRIWASIVVILVCGYGFFGRTFGYVGIPSAKLFIGDVVLAIFLVFGTRAIFRPWLAGLLYPSPFSGFFWSLIFFISYGAFELVRGLALEYPPLTVFQDFVFNVYPLYFFLGLWAATAYPDLLPRIVRFLAVGGCIYGLAYYSFLRNITLMLPGTDLPLIVGAGGGMALLGLPCFEKNLRRWWPFFAVDTFLVLGGQIRASWLGLGAALALRSVLIGKPQRFLWNVTFVVALLAVGYWTDFALPSPQGRGGEFSSREIVARVVAAVDRDAAYEYSGKNVDMYAGTVYFRTEWWQAIWSSVHSDTETSLLGHGYGYPLHNLVPYLRHGSDAVNTRTPHSIFYYALGYTGWIGVITFYSFQLALAITLLRVWRTTGQVFGIIYWLASLVGAHFGNFFETPFAAIPYYLMMGMAAADLVEKVSNEDIVSAQLVPAARW